LFSGGVPRRAARRRARGAAAGAAVLILAVIGALALRGSFEPTDLAWQSAAFRWRHDLGLDPARRPIVIVAWDQNSAQQLTDGWTRAATAALIDRLHAAGARLIMLDRLFEGPRAGTSELAAAMRRAGNVVLAQEISLGATSYTSAMSLVDLEPSIAATARGIGIANLPPPDTADPDARYRRYNYSIQAVRDAQGNHPSSFALAGARVLGVDPRSSDLTFLINFAGPAGATYPVYSLVDVLNGRQNLAAVRGAAVLVGDEVAADKDYFASPVDNADPTLEGSDLMYGVEMNANALNTLLLGAPLHRPGTPEQIALTFPLALLATGWAVRGRFHSSLGLAVALMVLLLACSLAVFLTRGLWIDVSAPLLALALAPLATLGVRFATEEQANRAVRALFGRYVSPQVVRRIVDDPDAFGLDGEMREITVLFSDIRGFTTLSEGMPPQQIVRLLSRYFEAMVEEIQAQGGTVDKYVGDAIMALFGAPDDLPDAPLRAVRAAVGMQRRLAALNAQIVAVGTRPIATGIGLHHGPAAVGVMGAPAKREYSAIGDTVNTASRLEGLTKDAGYPIVASDTVVAALSDEMRAELAPRDLGAMTVKGRAEAVRVYGLGIENPNPSA
jgi:adenylate cyclase